MSTLQYIVFPYSDLEEVPQEELDKRNLVPRISLNGKKALMKAEHYAEIFASKMIMTLSEDGIIIDLTGKQNGRGAYLCHNNVCLEHARKTKSIERALKEAVPDEIYAQLKEEFQKTE